MSFLSEFKSFAIRGNVVDLAVAVVVGAAFSKIVSALVEGIVMPTLGLILGGINITHETFTVGQAVIKWGAFLQSIIDFTIIALALFVAIKTLTFLRKEEEAAPMPLTKEEELLTEIRDLLKSQKHSSNQNK